MLGFLKDNWVNLLLIVVGTFALIVYILQERKKVSEAASLIKLQIDEIQEGISEIGSYIVNGQLNETAFYESQLLYTEDYWNKYKHYFVREMAAKDFITIGKLYEYASEIQEQQLLMKNLQKNHFFGNQQAISTLETTEIMKQLSSQNNLNLPNEFVHKLLEKVSTDVKDEFIQKSIELLDDLISNNSFNSHPNNIMNNKQQIISLVNQNFLTSYCPVQIRISLEKYINKYSLLEIEGTDGYKKIKKISERKF